MPRDNPSEIPNRLSSFHSAANFRAVAGEAPSENWCRAIEGDEPIEAGPYEPTGSLPGSGDLLGWSVILLTLPPLLIGAVGMVWFCVAQLS